MLSKFVQLKLKRLEQLCVHYIELAIGENNVLVALQNAAEFKLDCIKARFRLIRSFFFV